MRFPPTYNAAYDMTAFFPNVDVTTGTDVLVRPGQRTLIPDFLNHPYQNMLNQILHWTTQTYTGQKYSTMCYAAQGTTSLWEFNLAFNGLMHPCELLPGMQLRFPLLSEVQRVINAQKPSTVGKLVRI